MMKRIQKVIMIFPLLLTSAESQTVANNLHGMSRPLYEGKGPLKTTESNKDAEKKRKSKQFLPVRTLTPPQDLGEKQLALRDMQSSPTASPDTVNVAYLKPTAQSSVRIIDSDHLSSNKAVDGVKTGQGPLFAVTDIGQSNPWWYVDLHI